ncbi:hypothetical protein BDD12DRAFT_937241, partial [Trichophaea hybrida]
ELLSLTGYEPGGRYHRKHYSIYISRSTRASITLTLTLKLNTVTNVISIITMSTETHTEMDPLKEHTKSATSAKENGYASIGLALYTRVGNSSNRYCCCRGGYGKENRQRNGRGNGRHTKQQCTHCKSDSHTTEESRKRKCAQTRAKQAPPEVQNDNPSKEGNVKRTYYQCGLPGHFKANCIDYKQVQDQCTKIKKASR